MKPLYQYITVAFFSMLLGFAYRFHLPQIKLWILSSIHVYSYEKLPIVIHPENAEISLIPLALEIHDISIRSNGKQLPELKQLEIKRIRLSPDLLALFLGQAKIDEISIEDARMVVITNTLKPSTKASPSSSQALPTPKAFGKILESIPVSKISIKGFNYYARYKQWELSNLISGINLNISKLKDNLFIDFEIPHFKLKDSKNSESLLDFSINSKLMLTPENLRLESLRFFKNQTQINMQLVSQNWLKEDRKYRAELRTKLDLKQGRKIVKRFNKELDIPNLMGELITSIKFNSEELNQLEAKLKLNKFEIDGFKVGNINSDLQASKNKLVLKNFSLKKQKNSISIPHLILNKESEQWKLNSELQAHSFELRQLLNDIKVGDTPLRLDAKSSGLKCDGLIYPQFELNCIGKIQVPYFRVFNSKNNFTIHSFKNAELDGKVKINKIGVYPEANITLGKSTGKAKGSIEYKKGFSIDYESENFNFSDIESLAELPISGELSLTGNTKGNSRTASIDMKVNTKSLNLFDYNFGRVSTLFKYRKGNLLFNSLTSRVGRSKVSGKLSVDVIKSKIAGRLSSKQLYLPDAHSIIKNNLNLPVELKGFGSAYLNFEGPLQFNQLNYDLIYIAESLRVSEESFENLKLNLRARNGHLVSRELSTQKGLGKISGQLKMTPDYDLNIDLVSENLNLGDINFTDKLGGKMQAKLNSEAQIQGRIPNLFYKIKTEVNNLDIGGVNLSSSEIQYEISPKGQNIKASLFGKSLELSSQIPSTKNEKFFLNMAANDFNFTALFALLGINTNQIGFKSKLSGNVQLESNSGGLWASSGKVEISSLTLERGPLSLSAKESLVIRANKGLFQSDKWKITGDGTDLTYQVNPTNGGKLNSSIQGTLNLSLVSFAIPFIENLRGDLSLSTQLTGSIDKPNVSGSAFLKNASFKLPGLPHPFERIQSDIIFSNNKIVLNKIESDLAGGKLVGDGQVEVLGLTNVPTTIDANIKNASLEIIEGLNFLTNADVKLTGSWFPFTLSATANIPSGKISPVMNQQDLEKVRPSQYLPEILLEKSFDPIILQVEANVGEKVLIDVAEMQAYIRGQMKLTGPVGNPTYDGEMTVIPGGTLFFRDTPFNIETGNIQFRNIKKMNPNFYIDASTSIIEQSSQNNYDVSITVRGNLEEFNTQLESQPVLSESDLISLLALGLTSEQLDRQTVESQRDLQMMEIGAAVISNSPLGKELKDRTGFTFKLSTDIDETDTTQYKVVISKKVTPNVEASASILGNNAKKDVKLEYKLNNDLSLIGSWESTTFEEAGDTSIDQEQKSDIFGLDLRYKVEFK